jgi:CDGSH-type Zn-finger protein
VNNNTSRDVTRLEYKIKVTKNGPLVVTGGVPLAVQVIVLDAYQQCLAWRETRKYPLQPNYSLCRCGKSQNKHFDETYT